jgi:RNAse (barnase) inhibitor barstar
MTTDETTDKPTYVIDGMNFSTLEGFYDEVSRVLVPDLSWGKNLDAFNDIVRGYGTPEEGFTIIWKNSELSKSRLGYEETTRQIKLMMSRAHPLSRQVLAKQLADAEQGKGNTVFDWLVEIVRDAQTVRLILA